MKNLDIKLLKEFLTLAANTLSGEWLLVGGSLLPAVGIHLRSTADIDIVGLGDAEARQSMELMMLAEKLGLQIETINQAAAYFLRKVGYDRTDLILLRKGPNATIFRPSLSLYWRTKIMRLSDTDVLDCKHYLEFCRGQGDQIDSISVIAAIDRELASNDASPARIDKLGELKTTIKVLA